MLDPSPTPKQIGKIRDIVKASSKAEVAQRIDQYLDQSDWEDTLEDLSKWALVQDKHTIIDGNGVKIDKSKNRLDIRNRIGTRLGYPEVDEYGRPVSSSCEGVIFGTTTVKVNPGW